MALGRGQILKIIELVLVIICAVLHYNSMEADSNSEFFFINSVYGGYVLIGIGTTLGFILVDSAPGRRLDLYFTLLGGLLFLASAYLSWKHFHNFIISTKSHDYGIAKVWVSLATGIVFIVDAVFGFRD